VPVATTTIFDIAFAAAAGLGVLTVRAFLSAMFTGERSESLSTFRTITSWAGYALLALFLTSAVGINLSGFLVGSALIGVIVGVAAQSSLGNLFAGAVLVVSRPYRVGDWVYMRTHLFGGAEYEGVVTAIGALYTTLLSEEQVLRIPNASAVSAAVRTADVPMRARLELTLPATTQLRALRRIIREALELDEDDELVTSVQSMDCGEGGRLGCRVAIRARRPVDQAALLAAIRRAVDDTTSSARELEAVAISRR